MTLDLTPDTTGLADLIRAAIPRPLTQIDIGQRFAECARLAAETTPEEAAAAGREWEAIGRRG